MTTTKSNYLTLAALFAGCLLVSSYSHACQLTIRQAGFINKDYSPYKPTVYYIQYYFDTKTPAEEAYIKEMRDYFDNDLADVNIDFSSFEISSLPPKDRKNFEEDKDKPKLPFAVLTYGYGHMPWKIWKGKVKKEDVQKLVFSDTKKKISKELMENYALLIFSPGTDKEKAKKAREEMKKFVAAKKVPVPEEGLGLAEEDNIEGVQEKADYKLLEMDRKDLEKELPMAAGVGKRSKADPSEPWVGVVFGKGKMMDDVLVGKKLTGKNLHQMMGVLEQDCSCSVDIQSFTTDLPMPWTEKQNEAIVKKMMPEDDDMWDAPAETDDKGNLVEKKKK